MKFYSVITTTDIDRIVPPEGRERFGVYSVYIPSQNVTDFAEGIRTADERVGRDFDQPRAFIFESIKSERTSLIALTSRDDDDELSMKAYAMEYLSKHDYKAEIQDIDEITLKTFCDMLRSAAAYSSRFVQNEYKIMMRFDLSLAIDRNSEMFSYEEYLTGKSKLSLEEALLKVEGMATIKSLREEIERIYEHFPDRWHPGNPVHYALSADGKEDANGYLLILLRALYSCNRIATQRFTYISYDDLCDRYNWIKLDTLYRLQTGGAVVIDISREKDSDTPYLTGSRSRAAEVCRNAQKWKNKVLTVFCFPRESELIQKEFFSELDGMSLLKIEDGVLFGDEAKEYLCQRAKENEARAGKRLTSQIEEGKGYSKSDLRTIFETWYDDYLKRNVYPQYQKSGAKFIRKAEREPQGMGVEKLKELIGLSEAKELVANILDFAKVQQMYSFNGARKKQTLHMTFSGNPGTAKTTVARIVARVLKENSVLRNGDLVEVGRADLVGKYVGWTAVQVRQAFDRASGSVLFIDEAYSLLDNSQTFGDEAINTIVQEMENRREDVVVIFAGYPEKMEQFLRQNPGLRSRIGFHVHFPDYSVSELYEILEFTAKSEGMLLANDVSEKAISILNKASKEKEFGNGRYVRNLLEHARMRQAARLLLMDDVVTEKDAVTLVADDFEELRLTETDKTGGRIGFL